MRTNEERIRLIRRRTTQIRQERQKKRQQRIRVLILCACLVFVTMLGAAMPSVMTSMENPAVSYASGAASLVTESGMLGYIVTALLSFVLGICTAVLLFYLRKNAEKGEQKEQDDEL